MELSTHCDPFYDLYLLRKRWDEWRHSCGQMLHVFCLLTWQTEIGDAKLGQTSSIRELYGN